MLAKEYGIASSHAHRICYGEQRKEVPFDLAAIRSRIVKTRGCSVDDCASPHYGRGYCRRHYQQRIRRPRRPRPPITTYPGEVWKPVIGHEGDYEVSNLGRVKSLERENKNKKLIPERILKTIPSSTMGYPAVGLPSLKHSGQIRMRYVHDLVLTAFRAPPGLECRHLNGDPGNNYSINLKWGTSLENAQDKLRHAQTKTVEEAAHA